eukprot:4059553-Lingulodinium_polyedra.AAC.1
MQTNVTWPTMRSSCSPEMRRRRRAHRRAPSRRHRRLPMMRGGAHRRVQPTAQGLAATFGDLL